jgi:hypothetical protein
MVITMVTIMVIMVTIMVIMVTTIMVLASKYRQKKCKELKILKSFICG